MLLYDCNESYFCIYFQGPLNAPIKVNPYFALSAVKYGKVTLQ